MPQGKCDRRETGIATGLDVTREEVQVENNKQRRLVSQNEQESARLNVIRALGITFDLRSVSEWRSVRIQAEHWMPVTRRNCTASLKKRFFPVSIGTRRGSST